MATHSPDTPTSKAAKRTNQPAHADLDAAFDAACARSGLAATAQRRLIYRALARSCEHPTAESVYLMIRSQAPRLSLATVYRNLRLFAEAGIVDEVATSSSFARFDGNTRPHHHLICRECGSVADYYSKSLDEFAPSKSALDGFEVQSMKMNFFGVCASCSNDKPKIARRKK
jgi:Fur family peroxide stress response transcriptional regulator